MQPDDVESGAGGAGRQSDLAAGAGEPSGLLLTRDRGQAADQGARLGGVEREEGDEVVVQLSDIAQGPHPAIGHLHWTLGDGRLRGRCGEPVDADVEVEQGGGREVGKGAAQAGADVDIGRPVAQLAAVERIAQQIKPGVDPVAGREALRPKAVTVGGEDGVAKGRRRVLEVAGGRDVGESDQSPREDLGVGGEAVEEARGLDESIGSERWSQCRGQPVLGQHGSPRNVRTTAR